MFLSRPILIILSILYILGLFIHLHKANFSYKEAKYAICAIESNINGTHLEPTLLGKPCLKKPPLFVIFESLVFKIAGNNIMTLRAANIAIFVIFCTIFFIFLKDIIGFEASLFSTFGFAFSFALYFIYPYRATHEILYSVFIVFSILSMYNFKENGIIAGYIFICLAFLTNGFTSLLIFYLFIFLYAKKNIEFKKQVLSKRHAAGASLFLFIAGLWILSASHGNIHRFNYIIGELLAVPLKEYLSSFSFSKMVGHILLSFFNLAYYSLPFWAIFLLFFNGSFKEEFKSALHNNKKIKELFNVSLLASISIFFTYLISYNSPIDDYIAIFVFLFITPGVVFYVFEYTDTVTINTKIGLWVFSILSFFAFFVFLFDYEFISSKDYLIGLLALFESFAFIYMLKKSSNNVNTTIVFLSGVSLCIHLLYTASYLSYTKNYQPNYEIYAEKIAKFVLKKNPEYVMSDGGNLKLFFFLEKKVGMSIHPISKSLPGLVISRKQNVIDRVEKVIDTPKGVYYVGIKNGGV
jgi:4-amino-4-deoxy-L-arabinose transferase-like glycosyltransferase